MSDKQDAGNPVWLSRFWYFPVALVFATFYFGVSGWMAKEYSLGDALYRSLLSFGLSDIYSGADSGAADYSETVGPGDWGLQVCRWSGAATIMLLGSWALVQLIGGHWARNRARWAWKKVLVIGEHPLTETAVEKVSRKGRRCVHLGAGAFSQIRSTFRLPWADPRRKEDFVRAHAKGAKRILIAGLDDAETLTLARTSHRHAPTAVVTALVHSSYTGMDAAIRHGTANLRILNINDIAVRNLHLDNPPFLLAEKAGHHQINALIIGFAEVGRAVLRDLSINCRVSGQAIPNITVIDCLGRQREASLRQSVPELDQVCRFRILEGGFCEGELPPSPQQSALAPLSAVWLCLENDAETLAALGPLEAWLRHSRQPACPIFVFLSSAGALANASERIVTFGGMEDIVSASEFDAKEPDAIARDCHGTYLSKLSPEQSEAKRGGAAQPWASLSETYRIANRALSEHLPAKLASVGIDEAIWRVGRKLPCLPEGLSLLQPEQRLMMLAELEHERWNAERRWSGWQWAQGPKNEERRTHPDLLPFGQLSEETRSFDVAFVEYIDDILSSVKSP